VRANGSVYVVAVLALLVGYFSYQWWFNPRRAIKRQLGEIAATLSVPAGGEDDVARLARVARLRGHFAPDVRIALGSRAVVTSRDQLMAALAGWRPPAGGWTVTLVDVQVSLESESTARARMTVEVSAKDSETGEQAVESRDALVDLIEAEDGWIIQEAQPLEEQQAAP
jgi:hypothetical protein